MRQHDMHSYRPFALAGIMVLIGAVALFSLLRLPWWIWMMFFFFGLPALMRMAGGGGWRASRAGGWAGWRSCDTDDGARTYRGYPGSFAGEKPKRDGGWTRYEAADPDEKPKRRPVYAVGDDGELVEARDPEPVRRDDIV